MPSSRERMSQTAGMNPRGSHPGSAMPVQPAQDLASSTTSREPREASAEQRPAIINRLGVAALCALPGALVVYFGLNAGGFFPGPPALGAVVLALALATYTLVADQPFAGLSGIAGVAAGALALFAGWSLLSGGWSHAPGRAIVSADRVLLYLLVVVVLTSAPRSRPRLHWMVRGVVAAAAIVCAVGLATWLYADKFSSPPSISTNRLGYPVTYWNGLGLVAGLGLILSFYLTSSSGQTRTSRLFGAAVMPVLATTLYFTFSRGAIGVTVLGLVVYAALARRWTILTALAATAPPVAGVLLVAYGADKLASAGPTTAVAVSQGHTVASWIVIFTVVCVALRALALPADGWLARFKLSAEARRVTQASAIAGILAAVVIALAAGAGHVVSHDWNRFLSSAQPGGQSNDPRQRLLDPANNARKPGWDAALDGFRAKHLEGQGAGTYQLYWERHRPSTFHIRNAHSLYLETLDELGLVGIALLAVALIALLAGVTRRLVRVRHPVYAVIIAVFAAWALRASVDWDWQMPVVTAPVLALAAAALARGRRRSVEPLSNIVRLWLGVAWLGVAVMPALVAVSDGHLANSVNALNNSNWTAARSQALSSLSALSVLAQPYEVIGYADLEQGYPVAAIAAMRKAVSHDRGNWQYYEGLAVAQAASGLDPRLAAGEALARDPREPLAGAVAFVLSGKTSDDWRRQSGLAADYMLGSGVVGAR